VLAFSLNYDVLQFLLSETLRYSDVAEDFMSDGTRFNSAQGQEIYLSTDCFLLDVDNTILLFTGQGEAISL
jgi:hypothetical protein